MARPRQRLTIFPESVNGESPREAHQAFTAQKSAVLQRLAETLVELDKTEARHFDAIFDEEQAARQKYIQQFQSIAAKVQQLSEELEVDRNFRQEYNAGITRYTQEQAMEIKAFSEDMVQLRDLEHMVRGHLPLQLEALASLAHDIQMDLKEKADMNATKSRLTQINQRLARLEEVIDTKADRSELEALQERMTATIPDRNRLARCFELIAPAIRDPSRHTTQIKVQGAGTNPKGGKAKSKASASRQLLENPSDTSTLDRKSSSATVLDAPQAASPRPSIQPPTQAKAKESSAVTVPKTVAKLPTPPPAGHEGKAAAPTVPEGKMQPKSGAASKALKPPPPAATEAAPQAKAPEAAVAQPKA